MKATVQGTEEQGYIPTEPVDPMLLQAVMEEEAPLRPSRPELYAEWAQHPEWPITAFRTSVGTRMELLLELAGIKAAMRTWFQKQPDQVIREASAYSARLTEVWTELRFLEYEDRQWTQIRTMQVTPCLEEIDRQYKFATSRIAMLRQDVDLMTRGTGS